MTFREFIIEADGGSRGNPGPSGSGAVIIDAQTGEIVVEIAKFGGVATNNVAEYKAVLAGLVEVFKLDPQARIQVRMDSKLVVEQMSGNWKIKHQDMQALAIEVQTLIAGKKVSWQWIPREQNSRADALANKAIQALIEAAATVAPKTFLSSAVNATNEQITLSGHGFAEGQAEFTPAPKPKAAPDPEVQAEAAQSAEHSGAMDALKNGRVWWLGVAYFGIASSIYVTSFWMPTLIKQLGINDPLQIGWLVTIPYTVAIIAMVWCNVSADRHGERRWHTAIPCLLTATGLAISAIPNLGMVPAMIGLTLAAAGASTTQASFWSLPPSFLTGAAAAAGIALINSLGNIAGMASTSLVGWMTDLTGTPNSSLYLFAAVAVIAAVMVLMLPKSVVNK